MRHEQDSGVSFVRRLDAPHGYHLIRDLVMDNEWSVWQGSKMISRNTWTLDEAVMLIENHYRNGGVVKLPKLSPITIKLTPKKCDDPACTLCTPDPAAKVAAIGDDASPTMLPEGVPTNAQECMCVTCHMHPVPFKGTECDSCADRDDYPHTEVEGAWPSHLDRINDEIRDLNR